MIPITKINTGDRVICQFNDCARLGTIEEVLNSNWVTIQCEEFPFVRQPVMSDCCRVVPPRLTWWDRLMGRSYTY